MVNMSYCRFENTYNALQECTKHIIDGVSLSPQEIEYAKKMYELCNDFRFEVEYWGITDEDGNVIDIND